MAQKTIAINAALALRQRQTSQYAKEGSHRLRDLSTEALFIGLTKEYTPIEDGGMKLNPENKPVVTTAPEVLRQFVAATSECWDTVATVDFGNAEILIDVEVDGNVMLTQAPIHYVLYVEDQVKKAIAFLKDATVLNPQKEWLSERDISGQFQTPPESNYRVQRDREVVTIHMPDAKGNVLLPGKYAERDVDVIRGTWHTRILSGALSAAEKRGLLERAEKLLAALVTARETANTTKVAHQSVAKPLLDYIYGPVTDSK